jgi:hypothetical protein
MTTIPPNVAPMLRMRAIQPKAMRSSRSMQVS